LFFSLQFISSCRLKEIFERYNEEAGKNAASM